MPCKPSSISLLNEKMIGTKSSFVHLEKMIREKKEMCVSGPCVTTQTQYLTHNTTSKDCSSWTSSPHLFYSHVHPDHGSGFFGCWSWWVRLRGVGWGCRIQDGGYTGILRPCPGLDVSDYFCLCVRERSLKKMSLTHMLTKGLILC